MFETIVAFTHVQVLKIGRFYHVQLVQGAAGSLGIYREETPARQQAIYLEQFAENLLEMYGVTV